MRVDFKEKNRVEEIILGILNFHEWLFLLLKFGFFTFIVEQHMFYKLVLGKVYSNKSTISLICINKIKLRTHMLVDLFILTLC